MNSLPDNKSEYRPGDGGGPINSRPSFLTDQLVELFLSEHRHAEFLGLVELAAGFVAGDQVIGLLGDAAGRLAAEIADQRLDLFALVLLQRAGDDEGLAAQIG